MNVYGMSLSLIPLRMFLEYIFGVSKIKDYGLAV